MNLHVQHRIIEVSREAHGLVVSVDTALVINGVPARVHEIEQRFGALRPSRTAQPLGFGLALQEATTAASTASSSTVTVGTGSVSPTAASPASSDRGLTPAEQRVPGAYGPLTPPAELVGYGNGTIPADALAPVGETGHRLWAPAANGLTALLEDAAADGIEISITDSYRPIEVQERLAREKGLYSQGGLAAVPGTSNHGWGMATDLSLDAEALEWMRSNAWRYGFVEDVPREPWHWTYRPAG